jgi:hypothetical protein
VESGDIGSKPDELMLWGRLKDEKSGYFYHTHGKKSKKTHEIRARLTSPAAAW